MSSNTDKSLPKQYRYRIFLACSIFVLLTTAILVPVSGYLLSATAVAQTEQEANERANFWRAVRQGVEGYTAVQGQETNVLIQNGGENWRALRNGPAKTFGGWILAAMLLAIVLFFLIVGRARLQRGRSGMTIERWTLFERILHWYTASLFIILAITGLSLFYGRSIMIPIMGKDVFAAYAGFAKDAHNYLGPFFAAGLALEIILWIRHNIPKGYDFTWFAKGGGLVGNHHPHAGRMNGGEKVWFWLLATVGVALIASGFVLDFPNYGQTRETMQLAHLLHVAFGIILMAVALGHIYIGTLGTEGSIEGMVTGRVDTEWAKQHHDLWYDQQIEKGAQLERAQQTPPSGAHPRSG